MMTKYIYFEVYITIYRYTVPGMQRARYNVHNNMSCLVPGMVVRCTIKWKIYVLV